MGIKLRNCDKDSELKKFYLTFDTHNSATGVQVCSVIVPVKCTLDSISFSNETGASATASNALHIVVGATNVAGLSAIALVDYTLSGTVSGILANTVITASATAIAVLPAFANVTINISASSLIGFAHGVMTFKIDASVKD